MKTTKVEITDGKYFVGKPDNIIISRIEGHPLFVTHEVWDNLTGNFKLKPIRGQQLSLTEELYAILKINSSQPVYTKDKISGATDENICPRCGGFGYIQAYKHINGGICFECNGTGYKQ